MALECRATAARVFTPGDLKNEPAQCEARRTRSQLERASKMSNRRDLVVAILLLEFIALGIGLAMPITPSKTGGDFSFADFFFDDPTYLQEVLVYFVLTNLILGVLGLVALVVLSVERRRRDARR